ncbi:dodecin [Coraliomargarita parva]|uniref:dodecin n=1 Tax=Coraliomargarita parva TaxID=3014050 RepID=UPI0022B3E764|nr:dodecin [Coraliomargarita parva]
MSDHVYKKIELVGSSKQSIEAAVNNAVHTAADSVRNIRWLEVNEIRGHVVDGKVDHWQVGVKLGFTLEKKDSPETLEEKHHHEEVDEAITSATGGSALTHK